ncbi:hypothetical protein BDV09DRAFT_143405 [Aspergillus tetrazonus]
MRKHNHHHTATDNITLRGSGKSLCKARRAVTNTSTSSRPRHGVDCSTQGWIGQQEVLRCLSC